MNQGRGWILPWLTVVCLLLSITVQASSNLEPSFQTHSVDSQRQSSSLPFCRNLRVLSHALIRNRAGPQNLRERFLPTDVFLRIQDLGPVGPPWLEYRGPPGPYRGSWANVWAAGCDDHQGDPLEGITGLFTSQFSSVG